MMELLPELTMIPSLSPPFFNLLPASALAANFHQTSPKSNGRSSHGSTDVLEVRPVFFVLFVIFFFRGSSGKNGANRGHVKQFYNGIEAIAHKLNIINVKHGNRNSIMNQQVYNIGKKGPGALFFALFLFFNILVESI